MQFEFKKLILKDAYLISNFYTGDNRGGFTKTFEKEFFKEAGIEFQLNETFASHSVKNVIRGLHFQMNNPQAKLVSVLFGAAWDVIVDLRPDSPTFKQWIAHELSADNHLSFYVPRGFAHGFMSLHDGTVMLYQCDGKYDKETDSGIRFDDCDIGITWPIGVEDAFISDRDLHLMSFKQYMDKPMSTNV